jgi:hypothetical protein
MNLWNWLMALDGTQFWILVVCFGGLLSFQDFEYFALLEGDMSTEEGEE